MVRQAASLAASIKKKFGIEPLRERGAHGQFDVFVAGERLDVPKGLFSKLIGRTERAFLAEVQKRVAPA